MFLHELKDAKDLFLVISEEISISPSIVEKDYWVMHALWGLHQQGYDFELKGGTSLSKGYDIINRFSEDIDIQIHPEKNSSLRIGKNHNKNRDIQERRLFFNDIANELNTSGLTFKRDNEFDDRKMRSAGIRGTYDSHFESIKALKEGILFEVGFNKTNPFEEKNISSWAFEKAVNSGLKLTDNRAKNTKCYKPEYTFVEKLQTISTKYRIYKKANTLPINFLRHYYDLFMLLNCEQVKTFIKTANYGQYKLEKFSDSDHFDISTSPAFFLNDKEVKNFDKYYQEKSEIYFGKVPTFVEILDKIQQYAPIL